MEFIIDPDVGAKAKIVTLVHENEELHWGLKSYNKLGDLPTMFRDINAYWKWRGKEECTAMFEQYKKIHYALENVIDANRRFKAINAGVVEIAKYHPIELVKHWVETRSSIRFPDNLKTELEERDKAEQTYFKDEYYELTALSVALKFMVPIWGEYNDKMSGVRDNLEEVWALGLLAHSEIEASRAYSRLREFVESIVEETDSTAGSVLEGIGTLTLPTWLFAGAVVSKLSVSPLSHDDDGPDEKSISLIANTYIFLNSRTVQLSNKKSMRVKNKELSKDESADPDNLSVAEQYKPKQNLSEVALVTFDYFTKNWRERGLLVKPDIDISHVEELVKLNSHRRSFNLDEFQLKLIGIVTRKVISPRAVPYTNREGVISLLSIAQAVVHEWGFSTIADLMGAINSGPCNGISCRTLIREDQTTILNLLYPYRRNVRAGSGNNKIVAKNPGEIAINAIVQEACSAYWETNSTEDIRKNSTLVKTKSGWVVPPDFRTTVADFIIAINSNNI